MKNKEIKLRLQEVNHLINYCSENKIKNSILNITLFRNLNILKEINEILDKCVSQELKDIETSVWKSIEDSGNKDLTFIDGLELISKADKEKHQLLMVDYIKDMEEETDITLVLIDSSKLPDIAMGVLESSMLEKLIKW